MLSLSRAATLASAFLMAAVVLAATPSRSYAESGSVSMRLSKVGFIVGVGGGSGTLNFKGRQYRLSISGVSAGTIGVATMQLVGTATNLRTAADIAGSYSAVSAGVAVAGYEARHAVHRFFDQLVVLRVADAHVAVAARPEG